MLDAKGIPVVLPGRFFTVELMGFRSVLPSFGEARNKQVKNIGHRDTHQHEDRSRQRHREKAVRNEEGMIVQRAILPFLSCRG